MTTELPKDIGPRNVEGVIFPLRYEAPTEEHARAVEQAAKKLAEQYPAYLLSVVRRELVVEVDRWDR